MFTQIITYTEQGRVKCRCHLPLQWSQHREQSRRRVNTKTKKKKKNSEAEAKNEAMGARLLLAEWLFLNNEVYDPLVVNKQANTVLPIQVNLLPNMQLISNMCILT